MCVFPTRSCKHRNIAAIHSSYNIIYRNYLEIIAFNKIQNFLIIITYITYIIIIFILLPGFLSFLHEFYCMLLGREFLAPGAHNPVNVDCQIMELVRRRMENTPTRFCFEEAQVRWPESSSACILGVDVCKIKATILDSICLLCKIFQVNS